MTHNDKAVDRDQVAALFSALQAKEPSAAIDEVIGWSDVPVEKLVAGFMIIAWLLAQGRATFSMPLTDYLAGIVDKAERLSARGTDFPRAALERAVGDALVGGAPGPEQLFAVFSLLTRDELKNVGF